VPSDLNLSVKNVQTPYFAYLRRLSSNFTVELAFGLPPLTKTYGKGPATLGSVPYNGVEISSARWLAPSLLMEYVFLDDSYKLRPYFGVGLNYVVLYDRNSTPAGNAAAGGPTSYIAVELDRTGGQRRPQLPDHAQLERHWPPIPPRGCKASWTLIPEAWIARRISASGRRLSWSRPDSRSESIPEIIE
jgi:hypothetical protein